MEAPPPLPRVCLRKREVPLLDPLPKNLVPSVTAASLCECVLLERAVSLLLRSHLSNCQRRVRSIPSPPPLPVKSARKVKRPWRNVVRPALTLTAAASLPKLFDRKRGSLNKKVDVVERGESKGRRSKMISHFWNICNKACPALEVDKVLYHGKQTTRHLVSPTKRMRAG